MTEFGIEFRYNNKLLEETTKIHARLINQNKLKHWTAYSARFDKQDGKKKMSDEDEWYIIFNNSQNWAETDINKIGIKSSTETG